MTNRSTLYGISNCDTVKRARAWLASEKREHAFHDYQKQGVPDDRIGLLYDVTRTFGEQGAEIFISKAATIKDQVTDTFYIKDEEGKKIKDPVRLERLREALLEAVRGGVAGAGRG